MDDAQKIIDKLTPDMYVIVSEGWMKQITNKEESNEFEKNYQYGSIQKDKDRIEVLSFLGKSIIDDEKYSRIFKIIRKNESVFFDEMKEIDGSSLQIVSDKLK